MATENLRQRQKNIPVPDTGSGSAAQVDFEHPRGDVKHGAPAQIFRFFLAVTYMFTCCCTICATQFLGVPLYWIDRDLYYAYMALTKQSFGILVTTVTQWWSPTVVRISGDASVAGQIQKTPDGRVQCKFPDRMVMIANHQLYSDWLYLWWIAYANLPQTHGHIYIILKESLKHVPILGWGMRFFGFIFMSRKMATDQPRLAHRLKKLGEKHSGPFSLPSGLDPMWLLIFPEGTNASDNGRKASAKWAEKIGVKDMEHQLLPRSTGMFFCLNELKETVEYVYDCTIAYEGVLRGQFGQDIFSLKSIYLQGRPPKSINMYWRRFAVSEMPLDNQDKFDLWLRERWYEKDAFMEHYLINGRFPPNVLPTNSELTNGAVKDGFIVSEVKLASWTEVGNIYVVLAMFSFAVHQLLKLWRMVFGGTT